MDVVNLQLIDIEIILVSNRDPRYIPRNNLQAILKCFIRLNMKSCENCLCFIFISMIHHIMDGRKLVIDSAVSNHSNYDTIILWA